MSRQRKLMEEALRQSQASLQSLVDNAPFGIIRSSLNEDRFESLNPAMLKILGGYSLDEAMGLKMSTQIYPDPKDRGRLIGDTSAKMQPFRAMNSACCGVMEARCHCESPVRWLATLIPMRSTSPGTSKT